LAHHGDRRLRCAHDGDHLASGDGTHTLVASARIAALGIATAGGLWLLQPLLLAMGNFNLLVFFCGITAVCIVIGVPIAFGFGIATVGFLAFMTHVPLTVVVSRMEEGMSHLILLSCP